ncbi:MAG TPA: ATP-binding protein [Pedobacter sp.]
MILKVNTPCYTILAVNDKYLEFTYKTREELLGRNLFDIFPGTADANDPLSVISSFNRVINNKATDIQPHFAYNLVSPLTGQQETRYWRNVNEPIFDENGDVAYLIHTTTDITIEVVRDQELSKAKDEISDKTKALEVALKRAQAEKLKLERLFMEAPAIICVHSGPEFIFEFINPLYQSIFPGRDLLGKTFAEGLPELVPQGILEILNHIYQTGESFQGKEVFMPLAEYDGGPQADHYFNFIYQARRDEYGNIDGILVFAYEVTDQVLFRKKIQESEERLNLAVENVEAGVFDTDLVTEKTIRSLKHAQIYGYKDNSEDWTLEKVKQHMLPEDYPAADKAYKESISTGILNHSFRIKRADEVIRWVNTTGKVSYNEKGEPVRIIGTVTDITERKELEKQKDEFISTVSHELKTPVTSIKAYSQLLKRSLSGTENPDNFSFLERLDTQVLRLETLIRGLLDLSRIDTGKFDLKESEINMQLLLGEVVEDLQLITATHKLIITENPPIAIKGDKDRLIQVITNLVTNAVKYSPAADKVIISVIKRGGDMVCSIKDFGIGIQKEQKDNIFLRFHQVAQNERSGLSLGLGLYISKEIIENAGGKIGFESEPGEGSTFWFTLPLDKTN